MKRARFQVRMSGICVPALHLLQMHRMLLVGGEVPGQARLDPLPREFPTPCRLHLNQECEEFVLGRAGHPQQRLQELDHRRRVADLIRGASFGDRQEM